MVQYHFHTPSLTVPSTRRMVFVIEISDTNLSNMSVCNLKVTGRQHKVLVEFRLSSQLIFCSCIFPFLFLLCS